MSDERTDVAGVARLLGDPARAAMLFALMDGRALTATELADAAGVTRPTASAHLGGLVRAGLLVVHRQGRHRYHRLGGHDVAELLERLTNVAARATPRRPATGPRDPGLRRSRVCYDHLAGRLAVRFFDRAVEHGWLDVRPDAGERTPDTVRARRTSGDPTRAGRGLDRSVGPGSGRRAQATSVAVAPGAAGSASPSRATRARSMRRSSVS